MANSNLLIELKEYADDENKALPAKMFQRLMLKSVAQVLDESAQIKTRLVVIEKRHCDEDKALEKTDERRWGIVLLCIGQFITLGFAAIAIWMGLK